MELHLLRLYILFFKVNLFKESPYKDTDKTDLNNKYKVINGIIKFPIQNFNTSNITNFYKKNPFNKLDLN
jgi:hypothetical protein